MLFDLLRVSVKYEKVSWILWAGLFNIQALHISALKWHFLGKSNIQFNKKNEPLIFFLVLVLNLIFFQNKSPRPWFLGYF